MHRSLFSISLLTVLSSPALLAEPAAADPAAWRTSLRAGSGYQRGELEWTIPNGDQPPNILSELIWSDLDIWTNSINLDLIHHDAWVLQLGFAYGSILGGRNRDSDYLFSNRRGEFSRSYADVGGHTLAASALLGYRIELWRGRVALTPSLGYAFDRQKLKDTQGYQAIDLFYGETGPFAGLNSSYQADWHSGVLDLGFTVRLSERLDWIGGGSFSLGRYDAKAVWNLRDDFRQDPSFRHQANAYGASARIGLRYRLAPSWFLQGVAVYQTQWTDDGTEINRFTDGSERNRFNGATWESLGFVIGMEIQF